VGIVGFIDPPRKEVKDAIKTCQEAGIKVVMITGDHPETAKTIAGQVGINNGNVLTGSEIAKMTDADLKEALKQTFVFARVTPGDKLRLVKLLKENGEVVAVTGDGINDAQPLKSPHRRCHGHPRHRCGKGTMHDLTDDNFATIETAIKEGRKLFRTCEKVFAIILHKVALVQFSCSNPGIPYPLPLSRL
jgi:Ca2+-transporting ATPase